jgi:hypothetical protein
MLANNIGITIIQPYWAPALVDKTKCDVPMAILANSRPGPKFFRIVLIVDTVCGIGYSL